MKFKARCMFVGKRNANGMYYPPEVIKKMVDDFNENKVESGQAYGSVEPSPRETTPELDLKRVSHAVRSINLDDECVTVECETLDTPMGGLLSDLLREVPVSINPVMMGSIGEDNSLGEDAKVLRFDITSTLNEFLPQNMIEVINEEV